MTDTFFPFDGSLSSIDPFPLGVPNSTEYVYLAEIEAYNPTSSNVELLRFCTGRGFAGGADYYEPRLQNPGSFKNEMFAKGSTSGSFSTGYGEVTIVNIDGAYDYLADYGFDGRVITVRRGPQNGSYPNDFPVLYKATIEQPVHERKLVSFRLKDKQFILNTPIQTLKFAGDNTLPDGVEGVATDIKGRPKPLVFGKVWNIEPPCVNTSKLIYACNVRKTSGWDSIADVDTIPSVDDAVGLVVNGSGIKVYAIRDNGVVLTAGSVYTSEDDFLANAPSAGQYRVWETGGYFRLGSSPAGSITVDCADGSYPTYSTVANIVQHILLDFANIPSGEINSTDVSTINTANSSTVGVYVSEETPVIDVINYLTSSVGTWGGFDRLGVFRMKQIALPIGSTTVSLTEQELIDFDRLSISDTSNGIPAKRMILRWRKNYRVQNASELAGSVTIENKTQMGLEYRETSASDDTVSIKHPLASDVSINTAFYDEPTTETSRQFAIYKERRDRFKGVCKLTTDTYELLTLGTPVLVTLNRFGYNAGKKFLVIGYTFNCANNKIDVILWG